MRIETIAGRIAALEESGPAVARFDEARSPGPRVVLPSAFNPPTEAHLALMTLAATAIGEQPAALLTTRNVSKGIEGAPLEHRVGMLLAVRTERPDIAVLVANTARIVDQARVLRAAYRTRFDFIAGYDTLIRLFDPAYYQDMAGDLAEFFGHHRLVAANRAEHGIDEVERFVAAHAGPYAGCIIPLEIPPECAVLSSTLVRERANDGELPGVSPAVAAYIRNTGLYGTG